jgi:hypothetical protein
MFVEYGVEMGADFGSRPTKRPSLVVFVVEIGPRPLHASTNSEKWLAWHVLEQPPYSAFSHEKSRSRSLLAAEHEEFDFGLRVTPRVCFR